MQQSNADNLIKDRHAGFCGDPDVEEPASDHSQLGMKDRMRLASARDYLERSERLTAYQALDCFGRKHAVILERGY
jgi:hypothetical protein